MGKAPAKPGLSYFKRVLKSTARFHP